MNLLHINDRRGEYPASYYAATAAPIDRFPILKGATKADVCVVGGGYTGLSAALHLAQKGYDVVLLEAHRVGFGASGATAGRSAAASGRIRSGSKRPWARTTPTGSGTWPRKPRPWSRRWSATTPCP
jgi:predicted oxidoreductase